MSEHAVIIRFNYGLPDLGPMFDLETQLEAAIEDAGVGEFDGNEMAVDLSDGSFYMYGPDADALFHAVRPILSATSFTKGATATLRYGPPEDGVRERAVTIS